jgi:hypothetical protein
VRARFSSTSGTPPCLAMCAKYGNVTGAPLKPGSAMCGGGLDSGELERGAGEVARDGGGTRGVQPWGSCDGEGGLRKQGGRMPRKETACRQLWLWGMS